MVAILSRGLRRRELLEWDQLPEYGHDARLVVLLRELQSSSCSLIGSHRLPLRRPQPRSSVPVHNLPELTLRHPEGFYGLAVSAIQVDLVGFQYCPCLNSDTVEGGERQD